MESKQSLKVFLASPMDVKLERQVFRDTLQKINRSVGKNIRMEFEVTGWEEYVVPDSGDDAQDVVNQQIQFDYDIFVAIFGDYIGTPTLRSVSGSVEEYERALLYKESRPDLRIMCYFVGEAAQNEDILALKKRMRTDGILFSEVSDTATFEREVFNQFCQLLLKYASMAGGGWWQNSGSSAKAIQSVSVGIVKGHDLLIVRRSKGSRVGPGLWQIPGGKINEGEDSRDAAVREIHEELAVWLDRERLEALNVFQTHFNGNINIPFEMTLFLYRCGEELHTVLNEESDELNWLNLDRLNFGEMEFLGINLKMVEVIWREIFLTELLCRVLDYWNDTARKKLPVSLQDVSAGQLNMAYAVLSLLGVVKIEDQITFSSEYAGKIVSALLSISRNGASVFDNSNIDSIREFRLPETDYSVLKMHRERMLFSHQSLMTVLSTKATMENSRRNVCDLLVFGECGGKKYLLMRWDFFSNKFQLISAGVRAKNTTEEVARDIVARRFGEHAVRYFSYIPISEFQTYHFSAGSVDNDPILRRYDVKVVDAIVNRNRAADFTQLLEFHNSATKLSISCGWEISKEQAKELLYFKWCDLDRLLEDRIRYDGFDVRGISELIQHVGVSTLKKYSGIPITKDMIQDDFDKISAEYHRKMHETASF